MISQQLGFIPQNTAQVRNQTLQEQETGADVGWLCPMCGTGQATPVLAELPVHPQHHELPHSPVCTSGKKGCLLNVALETSNTDTLL